MNSMISAASTLYVYHKACQTTTIDHAIFLNNYSPVNSSTLRLPFR